MGRTFMISLVRHGETLANRQKIMQGQMNTLLSDLGIKQAQVVAERLKNEKFTHIFSSDLRRAADTAQTILEFNKYFSGKLVFDSRLRERGFGNLEGKLFADFREACEHSHIPMHSYTPEGGETLEQVTDRAKDFFSELCALMAEPLMNSSNVSSDKTNGTYNHITKYGESSRDATDDLIQTNSSETLNVEIPNCYQFSEAEPDRKSDGNSVDSSTSTAVCDLHSSNCKQRNQFLDDLPLTNVLIVSHGLLLRELKQLILINYEGQLLENQVADASKICPNTGLSQFTMCVSIRNDKVCVRCEQVHLISDASHLASSTEDLISYAKFKGAL